MWGFPSIQEFIASHGFQFTWTLLVFVFSALAWLSVYFSIRNNTKESSGEFVKNLAVGLVTFLLLIFSSCGLIEKYNETSKCRSLDLTKVKGVRVKKMNSEGSFGGTALVFNDEKQIQEGLKLLERAYHRDRRKDRFIRGYELQLILEDSRYSEFYIRYFAETDKADKADVIIPHCDSESSGFKFSGGNVYSSSTFGDWIRQNIEPHFKNQ